MVIMKKANYVHLQIKHTTMPGSKSILSCTQSSLALSPRNLILSGKTNADEKQHHCLKIETNPVHAHEIKFIVRYKLLNVP